MIVDPALCRVLIPATAASPSQVPAGAADLLAAVAAPRQARATWALAEELGSGRVIRSCAVRLFDADRRPLGYAMWINDSYAGGTWWSPLVAHLPLAHMVALVAGRPYTPPAPRAAPPKGPCWRCGRPVRWKTSGPMPEPYAHDREVGAAEDGQRLKIRCEQEITWSAQVHRPTI